MLPATAPSKIIYLTGCPKFGCSKAICWVFIGLTIIITDWVQPAVTFQRFRFTPLWNSIDRLLMLKAAVKQFASSGSSSANCGCIVWREPFISASRCGCRHQGHWCEDWGCRAVRASNQAILDGSSQSSSSFKCNLGSLVYDLSKLYGNVKLSELICSFNASKNLSLCQQAQQFQAYYILALFTSCTTVTLMMEYRLHIYYKISKRHKLLHLFFHKYF